MSDWSAGYVSEVGYTYGYYPELNPLRAKLALLTGGVHVPAIATACELGFGQGLSTNMHAAAGSAEWYGTDFNPAQAAFARELSEKAGSKATLFDDAFDEFVARKDLPDFDFISAHGIWSWISKENRAVLVDFIRRKLKPGGLAFISYNAMPGWGTFGPMRHLLTQHARRIGAEGEPIIGRIDSALGFADKMLELNTQWSAANPQVVPRLQGLKEQNKRYLAHEYFNRDWTPFYFSEMAESLAQAKLNYACSATLHDQVELIGMTPPQQKFLHEISDAQFRETVRDFFMNRQFRRDYWIKGVRQLTRKERDKAFGELRVVLISPRSGVTLKVSGGGREIDLKPDVYNPVLDALSDHNPRTVNELEAQLAKQGVKIEKSSLQEVLSILAGSGHVAVAQDDAQIAAARPRTMRLNVAVMDQAQSSGDIAYLASPVTGGAVNVGWFDQLFLAARASGLKTPQEWARFAWDTLRGHKQKIVKSGKTLETDAENLAEMEQQAAAFADKALLKLTRLQVI